MKITPKQPAMKGEFIPADFDLPEYWPVWWDTQDGRPAGQHLAHVLGADPYTGAYPQDFTHVLALHAPGTRKGYVEMAVDLRKRRYNPNDITEA